MGETPAPSGVLAVRLADALALFGDRRNAPGQLDSKALAQAAGAAAERQLGRAMPVLYAMQEHTRLTYTFSSKETLPPGPHFVGTCDALLTAEPWAALTVRTADCLPVAIAGGGAAAMVHAGWRGLAADVLGSTVSRLRAEHGVEPGALSAVVGVGIGPCHYEVGADVFAALDRLDVAGASWRGDRTVDLARFAAGRLAALGLAPEHVRALPGCTFCSADYHSYRRDGALRPGGSGARSSSPRSARRRKRTICFASLGRARAPAPQTTSIVWARPPSAASPRRRGPHTVQQGAALGLCMIAG